MRRWIIIVVVLVAVAAAGFLLHPVARRNRCPGPVEIEDDVTPTPLPAVQTNPEIIVDAVVVPLRYAELSMPASGIVSEILVGEGDTVEEGQLIAQLDNERQVIAIAQAEARVARCPSAP